MTKFLVLVDFLPLFAVRIGLQLQCHGTQQRPLAAGVTLLFGKYNCISFGNL